jgi:hypothetical protein
MAKVLFVMLQSEPETDLLLTKKEIRQYHDNDLLQLIRLTDSVMSLRPLTDNEITNFWLAIDERREREK